MPGAGRRQPQNPPVPGRDGGSFEPSFEPQPMRYQGRLPVEARCGLGVGGHRWHQNIVALEGSTGEWAALTEGEPQKRKRPGLCFESRDAR